MPQPRRRLDIDTAKRFIARYASPDEAVLRLLKDTYGLREKIRSGNTSDNSDFERQIDDMQRELDDMSGRLPKDGEVVISKADAEALTKYKALGNPDEVKTKVEKSGTLQTELDSKKVDEVTDVAAEALGYSKSVLRDQVRSRGLTIEMRDHIVDGKTVKAPFVKGKDANAAFELLTTYAERDLKDYLPALKAAGATNSSTTTQTTQTGVPFPVQTPDSSKATTGDAADQFLTRRNASAAARPNPLVPPAPAKAVA